MNNVKKEVKQLMELSATCKFIHEDNHTFTNFCSESLKTNRIRNLFFYFKGTIDFCLLYGLKKDFLNKPTSFDLVKKISKECKAAKEIVKIFKELENNLCNNQASLQQSESTSNMEKLKKGFFSKIFSSYSSKKTLNPETINHYVPLYLSNKDNLKHLWIKIAILRKTLTEIINYIIKNSSKFYYPNALMANSVDSTLLVALIAGPCSFDKYTRFKTIENADPDADELIRRHKLNQSSPLSPYRAVTTRLKKVNLNYSENQNQNSNRLSACFIKEFVESLHQNVKSQLVYGKNHVIVNQVNIYQDIILNYFLNFASEREIVCRLFIVAFKSNRLDIKLDTK